MPYSRTPKKRLVFPSELKFFLQKTFHQLLGILIICSGVCLAIAMQTYHTTDACWNLATDMPVENKLGFSGAVIADIFLQSFGVASLLFVIALSRWGILILISRPLKWFFFRFLALVFSVFFAASFLCQWQVPHDWPLPNSLGGFFGNFLSQYYYKFVPQSFFYSAIINIICFSLSLVFLIFGLNLSYKSFLKRIWHILTTIKIVLSYAFQWIYRLSSAPLGVSNKKPASKRIIPFEKDFPETPLTQTPSFPVFPQQESLSPTIVSYENLDDYPEENFEHDSEKETDYPSHLTKAKIQPSGAVSLNGTDYHLPSLDLLDVSLRKTTQVIDPQVLEESAHHLKTVLEEFGVRGEIVTVRPGPVVTMYEFKPAAGIKIARVIGLADDIARSMSALSARIAVIPGRNVIGIELPNQTRETVYLRELLQSEAYEKTATNLTLILGKDIGGQPIIADLARMPHLLVAGTTGSGKSVAVNTMILSILFRLSPDQCKFIMIDPKMLELSVYDDIPHLLSPVVTDPKKAVVALRWAVREMENRYRAMSKLGVRNIDGYNARVQEARQSGELLVRRVQTGFDPDSGKPIFENQPLNLETLPYIVVVVDEMADLMMVAGKEIEAAVQRLAQMARAAGIHLIMATQRPSVDVITGTIKANFPTRISFQVTSKIDSRTILGEQGAEQLLGQGDMLYMAGGGRITRVHGPFVRDDEVERVVAFLKTQADPVYVDGVTDEEDDLLDFSGTDQKQGDALYQQAVELVLRENKASTSFIQRHLQIGYNKAAGIIELMEKNGIVSSANHVGKREILR